MKNLGHWIPQLLFRGFNPDWLSHWKLRFVPQENYDITNIICALVKIRTNVNRMNHGSMYTMHIEHHACHMHVI